MNLRLCLIIVLLLTGFGSALAAATGSGRVSSDEVAALRRANQDLTAEVSRLRDNLVMLEARVLDQQKLVEELRAALARKKDGSGETTALPASPGGAVSELYLRAFADYAAGRFVQAADGFETFLRGGPPAEQAANARYWLAVSLVGQQQHALAVAEFRKLVADHPASPKAPDALAGMAAALQQLNLADQANEALETLRSRYPESAAAQRLKAGN